MAQAFETGLRQLWREYTLGRYLRGQISRTEAIKVTGLAMAAREAAKQLALTPVGSLGVVIRAYRRGLLNLAKAESAIADLYDVSSLFVTRVIVEMAIEQLRTSASRE